MAYRTNLLVAMIVNLHPLYFILWVFDPKPARSMCSKALARPADDTDAGNRPHKRIALETGEMATESDVVNLQKPYLCMVQSIGYQVL